MRFGLVGVPSILFFHRGRMIGKYNGTNVTLDGLQAFISRISTLKPVTGVEVTEDDEYGPVPGPRAAADVIASRNPLLFNWVLLLVIIFLVSVSAYFLLVSPLWVKLRDGVGRMWAEAGEAQHEHVD